MAIKIGEIEYANCTPIFTALKKEFDCGNYSFVREVPSTLNAMLSRGEVDISPSSSIEYGKSFAKYLLMPDISISSIGPVKSVFLFSRTPVENLHKKAISLTTESDTSVNLLKIILAKKYGLHNEFQRTSLPLKEALEFHDGMLLIGDAALKASLTEHPFYVYDLGQEWYEFTGFPFVFALWIVRRDAVAEKYTDMLALKDNLLSAKNLAYRSYESIALDSREREWMSLSRLVDYWNTISYDLTAAHIKGLETFYRYAFEMGLIPAQPDILLFD